MSATVAGWVPLAAAAVGAASTLGALAVTRWFDSRTRRQQWARDDSVRWLQERQLAYARLLAALTQWDNELGRASAHLLAIVTESRPPLLRIGEDKDLTQAVLEETLVDTIELRHRAAVAKESLALVELIAPKKLGTLARRAIGDREDFRWIRLTQKPTNVEMLRADWQCCLEDRSELEQAMRHDIGLEDE